MELTNKCKEDFENWLYGKKVETLRNNDSISKKVYTTTHFKNIPLSMQYGVYVDFFDSIGINIKCNGYSLGREYDRTFKYEVTNEMSNITKDYESECFDTRYEAITKALEKANEIYNKTK